ncbi:MAG TPA: restriction endonuclease [bacterium]|nr:restriction endonuclease [bacterium]
MPVPDFQSFFKPLLEVAADGEEHSLREAREKIAFSFNLGEEDRSELLPSGTQSKFDNRVSWAKSYLVQAKVLEAPKRARFKITERGKSLLSQGHEKIDVKVLNQYPEFVEFHTPSKQNKSAQPSTQTEESPSETPEEMLQKAYESIRSDLAGEILENIKANPPSFFEKLVVDLMVAMGYGGSRADAGKSLGKSGDEGIDGIIKEDRLGLDVIFLQAKRWEGTVGRPEIQKFVGALHGKKAKKGVFITTGKFSEDAKQYADNIDPKVILIDGRDLANYMIDFNVGTFAAISYEIKRIDSDYFIEE